MAWEWTEEEKKEKEERIKNRYTCSRCGRFEINITHDYCPCGGTRGGSQSFHNDGR